jgi:hypothetical protein
VASADTGSTDVSSAPGDIGGITVGPVNDGQDAGVAGRYVDTRIPTTPVRIDGTVRVWLQDEVDVKKPKNPPTQPK